MVESLIIQLLLGGFILLFAALAGAAGIGGGGLFTPILHIVGGITVSQAIPITSAAIVGVGLASTLVNMQKHAINYKLAMTLEPFTIFGTIIGVQIFLNVPEYIIMIFFAILMIFLSLRASIRAQKLKKGTNIEKEEPKSLINSKLTSKKTRIAIIGSISAGLISSIVGIGGGLIKVPMMSELGLSPRIASGTGSFMVLFTSLSITTQFLVLNQLELNLAFIFFSIGFIGSILGTYISRFDKRPYVLQLIIVFTITLSTIFIIGEFIFYLII